MAESQNKKKDEDLYILHQHDIDDLHMVLRDERTKVESSRRNWRLSRELLLQLLLLLLSEHIVAV